AVIYGMNFVNMPALHLHYVYYICLAVMFVIAVVLIIFFRRKKLF
ncbi:CorA family divalent cation transporter, partial [Staphylococcus aureus]